MLAHIIVFIGKTPQVRQQMIADEGHVLAVGAPGRMAAPTPAPDGIALHEVALARALRLRARCRCDREDVPVLVPVGVGTESWCERIYNGTILHRSRDLATGQSL